MFVVLTIHKLVSVCQFDGNVLIIISLVERRLDSFVSSYSPSVSQCDKDDVQENTVDLTEDSSVDVDTKDTESLSECVNDSDRHKGVEDNSSCNSKSQTVDSDDLTKPEIDCDPGKINDAGNSGVTDMDVKQEKEMGPETHSERKTEENYAEEMKVVKEDKHLDEPDGMGLISDKCKPLQKNKAFLQNDKYNERISLHDKYESCLEGIKDSEPCSGIKIVHHDSISSIGESADAIEKARLLNKSVLLADTCNDPETDSTSFDDRTELKIEKREDKQLADSEDLEHDVVVYR